jgi:hypothetical protein
MHTTIKKGELPSAPPQNFDRRDVSWRVVFGDLVQSCGSVKTTIPDPNYTDELIGIPDKYKSAIVQQTHLELEHISVELHLPDRKTCRVRIQLMGAAGDKPLNLPSAFKNKANWKFVPNENSECTTLAKAFEVVSPEVSYGVLSHYNLETEFHLNPDEIFFHQAVTIAFFICNWLGVDLSEGFEKLNRSGRVSLLTWLHVCAELRESEYFHNGKWFPIENIRDVEITEMLERAKCSGM